MLTLQTFWVLKGKKVNYKDSRKKGRGRRQIGHKDVLLQEDRNIGWKKVKAKKMNKDIVISTDPENV